MDSVEHGWLLRICLDSFLPVETFTWEWGFILEWDEPVHGILAEYLGKIVFLT